MIISEHHKISTRRITRDYYWNAVMRTQPGNKRLISFLACLFWRCHGRYFFTAVAFDSSRVPRPGKRNLIKNTRRQSSMPSSPQFFSFFGKSAAASTAFYFSKTTASTSLFSTSSSTSSTKKTRYTIDDSVCLPTKTETLEKAVHKACRSLDVYIEKKPAAAHTRRAFEVLVGMIDEEHKRRHLLSSSSLLSKTTFYDGIVLDSGCGTGRSTKLLASSIHPQHLVIGVDRSFARLTKTKDNRQDDDDNEGDKDDNASKRAAYCHQVSENAYLVRAELVDFWRCCIEHGWTSAFDFKGTCSDNGATKVGSNDLKITHHYMLYPNPYPTNARLSQRWYAHPSFPLILKLGIQKIVVRSNWEGYLNEFSTAIEMANEFYVNNEGDDGFRSTTNLALPYLSSAKVGPTERIDKSVAYTNFESKYDNVGECTYELILDRENIKGNDR